MRTCLVSVVHTWTFDPQLHCRPDLFAHICLAPELLDPRTFEGDGQGYVTVGAPFNPVLRACLHVSAGFIQPPQADFPPAFKSAISEQDALQRLAPVQADVQDVYGTSQRGQRVYDTAEIT